MKIIYTFLVLAVLICACRSEETTQKYTAETEGKIQQVENNLAGWVQTGFNDRWNLAERMKKHGIKGVSIAVIHDFKVEWARGYGYAYLSENRQVDETTLFQAASISKSLNSLGVLKLVQEKKLDLDADINEYLKSWKFPYDEKSNNRKITVRNLLSHTGGLSVHGFPGYSRDEVLPSLQMILDGIKPANTEAVRSIEEPGKSVIYSGGGTTISQLIIMDITMLPYDRYMKKYVLDPLGMKSSFFTQPPPSNKEKLLAAGYKPDGSEVPGKFHIYPEQAAAGLWTNPSDLCRYIIETQLSFIGKSSKVLSPEMTKERLKTVLEDAALGTFVNTRVTGSYRYFNHNGGNEGFSCTSVGCIDSGDGVVVMTNSDNPSILEEIVNSVATVYNWKDYYLPEMKKVIHPGPAALQRYTGRYDMNGRPVTIALKDTVLFANPFGNVQWQLYFTSDTDFFVRESRGMASFRTGKNNEITGFWDGNQLLKKTE